MTTNDNVRPLRPVVNSNDAPQYLSDDSPIRILDAYDLSKLVAGWVARGHGFRMGRFFGLLEGLGATDADGNTRTAMPVKVDAADIAILNADWPDGIESPLRYRPRG